MNSQEIEILMKLYGNFFTNKDILYVYEKLCKHNYINVNANANANFPIDKIESSKSSVVSNVDKIKDVLNKIINISIDLDKSFSYVEFASFCHFDLKSLFELESQFFNELSEMYFYGYRSELTSYLLNKDNKYFKENLLFLENTRTAIKYSQRLELKKKFEKLDELNKFELTDSEIKIAITLNERQRLKAHFAELSKKDKGGSAGGTIIKFDFRQVLKYAAIIVFVLGSAIFLINRNDNGNTSSELAHNDVIKQADLLDIKNETSNFQLPNAINISNIMDVLSQEKFGFADNTKNKIKITLVDLSPQFKYVEGYYKKEIQNRKDTILVVAKLRTIVNQKLDSLKSLSSNYKFDSKNQELVLYTNQSGSTKNSIQQLKLIAIENDKLYLKEKKSYYLINRDGLKHKLIKETSEDVIDQLDY